MAQLLPLPLTISSYSKIQIGFTFLVLAIKRMRACVPVFVSSIFDVFFSGEIIVTCLGNV